MNKTTLVYDMKSFPHEERYRGLKPEKVIEFYQREGVVLWDSANCGTESKIYLVNDTKDYKIIDVRTLSKEELDKYTNE